MRELIFCALVVVPAVFLTLAIRLVMRGIGALRRGRLPSVDEALSAKPLGELAVMSAIGTALVWALGIAFGFFLLDPGQMCAMAAARSEVYTDAAFAGVVTHHAFPVAATCAWADGTEYDLVPGWINPLIALFALTFVAALLALTAGAVRRRQGRYRSPKGSRS
ncbi:hypothetical protein [Sphaerisporangium dianthi]|uniref:Transporter n=1 Tax=Sphaerisporangium dianthi TaxID=1436120 RepID=A0ABV9C8H6_9ACTN